MAKSPAWQRKEGKNPEGGLNKKGVASYRAANPGSKLKTAVTTKPSKLKKGSKSANRRKSFCARMGGMKKRLTSAKTANDPNSRINKSLRKWNCEDGGYIETKNTGGPIMARKRKNMIPNESPMPALDQVSYEEAGDFVSKPKVSKPKLSLSKVKEKKMTKMPKKESRWSKFKSKFKAKKVEKPKAKKRNIVNIKKMQDDTPTGIKKKKISDWQGKKTKLTAKQKKAKADAYKSPMTGVEKAAAKKKGITKADQYSPVDQSKGVSKAKTVTRKDTTVKTKGGDFPVYRKDTTSSKSFSKTFAEARKAGKKTFTWQGRKYSTKVKGEKKHGGKVKKYNMGGMVDVPQSQAFKQGIKYFEGGGRISVSNDNAGAGDVAHVHSHSGYKAGE